MAVLYAVEQLEPRLFLSAASQASILAALPPSELGTFTAAGALELSPVSVGDAYAPTYVTLDNRPALGPTHQLLPFTIQAPGGMTPAGVRHAYGIDQINFGSLAGDGTGQTIAIVDAYDYPTAASDLHAFDQAFALPDPPSFTKVNQDGGATLPGTDPAAKGNDWEVEEALDIEWAHAIAPGASIVLVEANSPTDGDLMQHAVNTARNIPGVVAVSMSFGRSEEGWPDVTIDTFFSTPAGHTGVTFLASSGDSARVEFPSTSPDVLAVGGTTLSLDTSGNYNGETAWSDSGGGPSNDMPQPVWQKGIVTQKTTWRAVPDVAFDANPSSGASVYDSYDFGASTPWAVIGGTSFSAPAWAGLIAIADQGRAAAGAGSLDGPTQTLPWLYSMQAGSFHDIISGGTTHYSAGPGYDLVTGRGSPIANSLIPLLVSGGAYVTGSTPTILQTTPVSSVEFSFNAAMDPTSFSVDADVDSFTGPGGADLRSQITGYSWLNGNTTLEVDFTPPTGNGAYTMTIGPQIRSAAGALMDQNFNTVTGENSGDQYSARFLYSNNPLSVVTTSPAPGSNLSLPFSTLDVQFNQPVDASTINIGNLNLSQGSVAGVEMMNSITVRYFLDGISAGTLDASFAYGAVRDALGLPIFQTSFQFTLTGSFLAKAALLSETDSGASNSDGITNFDNSSPGKALRFSVPGTVAGDAISIYADDVFVGSALATEGTTIVTTNGLTALNPGFYAVTWRDTPPGGSQSPDSAPCYITVATAAAAPSAPILDPANDSGSNNTDEISNKLPISVDVTAPGPGSVSVQLDGNPVYTTTQPVAAAGNAVVAWSSGFAPEAPTLFPSGSGETPTFVADFNGDGKLDILTFARFWGYIAYGNGDGTFQSVLQFHTNINSTNAVLADFNGDGLPDFAISLSSLEVQPFLNTGTGFVAEPYLTDSLNVRSIAAGDFNHDGKIDLLVTHTSPNNTAKVWLGNGDGTFSSPVTSALGVDGIQLALVDVNGDGKLDIAIPTSTGTTEQSTNFLGVCLGNGNGTFATAIQTPVDFIATEGLTEGDYNHDGKLDFFLTNGWPNTAGDTDGETRILLGNGDGTFTVHSGPITGTNPVYSTTADFNGDGIPDIAVGSNDSVLDIFRGNGDGTFVLSGTYAVNAGTGNIAAVDLNGDGRLDLVTSDSAGQSETVLLGTGANPVPGVHTVRAWYTDLAGNVSALSGPTTITIDQTPPTVGNLTGPAYPLSPAAPQDITVVYTDDLDVDISTFDNSDILLTGPNGYSQLAAFVSADPDSNSGSVTATYQALPPAGGWTTAFNGTYTATLQSGQVKDLAGNSVPPGVIGAFQLDVNGPPGQPQLAAATDSGISSSDSVTSFNNSSPSKELQFSIAQLIPGAVVTLYCNGIPIGSGVASGNSMTLATDGATKLSDGTHVITARQVANNVASADSPALSILIDTTPPVAGNLAGPPLTTPAGSPHTFTVTFTDDDSVNFSTLDSGDFVVNGPGGYSKAATFVSATPAGNGSSITATYQLALPASGWTPATSGTYVVNLQSAQVGDIAGNLAVSGAIGTFLISIASAPGLPVLAAATDSGISSSDGITNFDNSNVSKALQFLVPGVLSGATVTVYADGVAIGSAVANGTTATITTNGTTQLSNSHHSITATQAPTNAAPSGLSGATVITIDTIAPAAPTAPSVAPASDSGISNADGITNNASPAINFTAAEAGTAYIEFDGNPSLMASAPVAGPGTIAINAVFPGGLPPGTHTLTGWVSDVAGNVSAMSGTKSVTIDTTAPSTPPAPVLLPASDTGVSNSDGLTDNTTPTFIVTNTDAYFRVFANGNLISLSYASGTTFTAPALSPGVDAITVAAIDAAGNISGISASTSITIDTLAPTAGNLVGPPITTPSASAHTFTITYSDNVALNVGGFANSNILVTGPAGYSKLAAFVSANPSTNASPITVTYQLVPPTGGWSATANGTYTAILQALQISDTAGNVAAAAVIGTFPISIATAPGQPVLAAATDSGVSNSDAITKFDNSSPAAALQFSVPGTTVGDTVTIYADGIAIGSATATSATTLVTTSGASALASGAHAITARRSSSTSSLSVDSTASSITIDAVAPSSTVAALPPSETSPSFNVAWSGSDSGGAGISTYTIYVSDNGGTYTPWLSNTALTSATYGGAVTHTYAFYSVATDAAGNVQAAPSGANASTTVAPFATTVALAATSPVIYGTAITFTATVTAAAGAAAPTGSVSFIDVTAGNILLGTANSPATSDSGVDTWIYTTGVKQLNVTPGDTINAVYNPGAGFSGNSGTTTEVVTTRPITVTAAANIKTYDGTLLAMAPPSITSGTLVAGDTANFAETYDTRNVGIGKTLVPSGFVADGKFGSNYAVTFVDVVTGVITAAPITVTASPNSKGYDGTTGSAAIPAISAGTLASGDTANFAETYDTKNAGTGKLLTPSGAVNDGNSGNNYAVTFATSTAGVISARSITVTATANSKTYDGTTTATAIPPVTAGALATGDTSNFAEFYDSQNAGTGKLLTPSGAVNDGNGGSNYAVTFVTNSAGVISVRSITVTATINSKTYDGTTAAAAIPTITAGTLAAGDTANLSESYDTRNVGAAKMLTPAGAISDGNGGANYSVTFVPNATGVISARSITVTAATNSKTYDGATTALALPTITSGALATGDTSNFAEFYDSQNAGTGKLLTPSGTVNDGNSGNNYAVTFVTSTVGVISVRSITVTAAINSKTYDGTTAAAAIPTITAGTLATGDTAALSQSYDTRNVGAAKTLTPAGSISDGNGGANYSITFVPSASGVISARSITVTAATNSKTYDGTIAAAAIPTITSGALAIGDTSNFAELYDSPNVGTGRLLTPSGAVNDGNGGSNYAVTYVPNATGGISARSITVTATINSKTYDGSTSAAAIPTITAGTLAIGDSANLSESYDTGNVGIAKMLMPGGSVIDGNGGANYSVTFVPNATGVISARSITVTATMNSKTYDGTTAAAAIPTITAGTLATGDTANLSESYDTRNVGAAKMLTPAGSISDGNGGANYSVTFVPNTTGVISARSITVTAATDSKAYDGATTAAAIPTISSGALATGDTANFIETYDTANPGVNKTLTPSGSVNDGNNGNNYGVVFLTNATGTIAAPAPVLVGVTPGSVAAGAPNTTITLTGTGLMANSVAEFNGGAIATTFVNGTTLTAVIPSADLAAAGADSVTIFTPGPGGGVSSAQSFTVLSSQSAPLVLTSPASVSVTAGHAVSFTATAAGGPAPTVQWQMSTNNGATFTSISGATAATYTFTATSAQNNYIYRAVFANALGTAVTAAAAMTVIPANIAPAITTQPVSESVAAGNTIYFIAGASGTPAPGVQWQLSTNGGTTWANISGATSAAYSFTAASTQNGSKYRAIFTNAAGSATTSTATLTVTTAAAAPVIITQPQSQSVNAGTAVNFIADASGNPTPTVQWQLSTNGGTTWSNISGATSRSYSFTATSTQNAERFRAVFTSSKGTATSSAVALTVVALAAPAITTQPVSQSIAAGNLVIFTAAAGGNPAPTVQWQLSTNAGSTWTNIAGATFTEFTVTAAPGMAGYKYRAVFANSQGTATSSSATLTVTAAQVAPMIVTQPTPQTVNSGISVTFTVSGNGTPAPTIQWQVNTTGSTTWTNISGATSANYTFTPTITQNGYQYRAVLTNAKGTANSNAAKLIVQAAPAITSQPANLTVKAGATASFTVAATGNPTPTVMWQVSTNGGTAWTNISGATSPTYSFSASSANNGYKYRAVVTNSLGTVTSNTATLTIGTVPVITTQPLNKSVVHGASVTFTAAASATPTATVQWQLSTNNGSTWANITGATSTSYTFTTATSENGHKYRAVFTNSLGTATSNAASLAVS